MNLKNLDPKIKRLIVIALCIVLVFLSMFAGGIYACHNGNGKLMEDFSCIDTARLDLCKDQYGMVWQYYDDKIPKVDLNLSNNEAG